MDNKVNINKTNELDSVRATRKSLIPTEIDRNSVSEAKVENSNTQDKLQLSGKATEIFKLVEEIKLLPDVRQDKVDELRRQIEIGEYQPSNEAIANAILNKKE
jgi:negative regulator of flagellin synthesis FlgM